MEKKLEYITFKQFIYTINIRQYINEKQDAYPIRIYLDVNKWIDLGWYDWTNKGTCMETLELFLKKEILDSYVTSLGLIEDTEQIYVYLEENPQCSLEES